MKKFLKPTLSLTTGLLILSHSVIFAQDLPSNGIASETDVTKTNYNPLMPKIKDSEAVDTLFPDPLAESFQKKSHFDETEKNKSLSKLIEEFESKAARIASETVIPDKIEEDIIQELTEEEIKRRQEDQETENEENETDESEINSDKIVNELKEVNIPDDDSSKPLPDMPDSSVTQTSNPQILYSDIQDKDENKTSQQTPEKKDKKKKKKKEPKYEKIEALEPVLLENGDPSKDELETERIVKLVGRIIPEIKHLSKKKQMFRWVLKQDNGNLIPLRSNVKLMQEVKDEELFDKYVIVTGYFQTSGMNKEIKYFILSEIKETQKPQVNDEINKENKTVKQEQELVEIQEDHSENLAHN